MENKTLDFNGGKMRHPFKTVRDSDADSAMSYIPEWFCDEAREAMMAVSNGEATVYRKIDGSCGALVRNSNGTFDIYQRFDDKKNKFKDGTEIPEGYIRLPDGENTNVPKYEENFMQHRYYFKLIPLKHKSKGEQKISDSLYKHVQDLCIIASKDAQVSQDFHSIELVGPNFNRTSGVVENNIAVHSQQLVDHDVVFPKCETPEEWFVWLTMYFTDTTSHKYPTLRDEGLIIEHKGRYWKIHGYKFGPDLPKEYRKPCLFSE